MSAIIDLLNRLSERIESTLNRLVATNTPCIICPDAGCITLDFSDCNNFEILVTEDITCMRMVGEGAPGDIEFIIPPGATRFITGFPQEWFPEGNEGSIPLVGGADGKTFGFRHSGSAGGPASGGSGKPGIKKKKPVAGGVPTGGGGGAGGTCPCVPDKDRLTLVVCGKLNCGDASPKFEVKACGGFPGAGYSWDFTGNGTGTITGGSLEKFSLAPPANTGSAVAGTAYKKDGKADSSFCFDSGSTFAVIEYGCDGLEEIPCNQVAPNICPDTPPRVCAGGAFPGFSGDCPPACTNCGGFCSCVEKLGRVCDVRTQTMIDNGCKPCTVEMSRVVVTVTDALGTSVSKTVEFAGATF